MNELTHPRVASVEDQNKRLRGLTGAIFKAAEMSGVDGLTLRAMGRILADLKFGVELDGTSPEEGTKWIADLYTREAQRLHDESVELMYAEDAKKSLIV